MITAIEVVGFKRFKRQAFKFAPLTMLAGLNGSGKTSLVQSLLLTSVAGREQAKSISLNGPFGLQLGKADDVLNWDGKWPIQVSINSRETRDAIWHFSASNVGQHHLDVQRRPRFVPSCLSGLPRSFTYLSAERLGPRSHAVSASSPDDDLEVGVQGEFSAQVLSILGDKPLEVSGRQHPLSSDGHPRLLKYEVEQWLAEIVKPIALRSERLGASSMFEMSFRASENWVSAPNMGFGFSYALPIILAGLTNLNDSLLIVENPEAHLHPAGQSRMGTFLAWLAARGVQVLLETHSDHVLNGIRRAVGEYKYLPPEHAIMHFFLSDGNESIVESLEFTPTGAVTHWPQGFFDQYQIDVTSLGRIRRQRS